MSQRVIVAFPRVDSTAQWRQVLAVRDRYDPLAARIPPHLTLVFPFEDALSDRELEAQLRHLIANIPPFDVTFAGITAHENEYLFLNVKRGNDAIIHLHDVLYSGALAGHLVRNHTFVPHVTVGRLPSRALLAQALDATAELGSPIDARVDSISVYRIDHDRDREVLSNLPLAAQSSSHGGCIAVR